VSKNIFHKLILVLTYMNINGKFRFEFTHPGKTSSFEEKLICHRIFVAEASVIGEAKQFSPGFLANFR
jgi:hypothetical protein